jgi:putative component of membrane protein insertase Oxa1/YidC/SpoIIIJ protein YidD
MSKSVNCSKDSESIAGLAVEYRAAAVNERYMRNGFFIGFKSTDCFSPEIMRHLNYYPSCSKYGPLFLNLVSDVGMKKAIQRIIHAIHTLRVTSWERRGLGSAEAWRLESNQNQSNQSPVYHTQQQ